MLHDAPDDRPPEAPPAPPPSSPPPSSPPLLDYPSRPGPPELETERWGDVVRAAVIVFGAIAVLFFGVFGLCGLAGRGCG